MALWNGGGAKIMVELIADFPGYTPNPLPFLANNVRGVNPFDLVVVDHQVYVTDGAQNSLWQVDISTGAFSTLTTFPNIPNPFFPGLGGPFIEPVPTGLRYSEGQLLVTLFKGFPFLPGTSEVCTVDPGTGSQASFISGLSSAIDPLTLREGSDTDYLVLQFASGPFLSGPGLLLRFETPGEPPTVLADCLITPTSMTFDEKTGTLYVTELAAARIIAIPVAP